MQSFNKGKILGPDGILVEFYLGLFEILEQDLSDVVEESMNYGKVLGALNLTFITMIPKKQDDITFVDYRPIYLWNMIYKLISKIIFTKLKGILSNIVLDEKFVFLWNHQIHDVVGIAQEGMHSIKTQKLSATIMKIYLTKAYDKVNSFLLEFYYYRWGWPYW